MNCYNVIIQNENIIVDKKEVALALSRDGANDASTIASIIKRIAIKKYNTMFNSMINENSNENINLQPKNLFTVNPKSDNDMIKSIVKSFYATKYAGFGTGSTGMYADQIGSKYANTHLYSNHDVVFVSVNGKGKDANGESLGKLKQELLLAIKAGATIIKDNEDYIHTSWKTDKTVYNKNMSVAKFRGTEDLYNIGEKEISLFLHENGYLYYKKEFELPNGLSAELGVWLPSEKIDFATDLEEQMSSIETFDQALDSNNKIIKNEKGLIIIEDALSEQQSVDIIDDYSEYIRATSFKQTAGSVSWGWGLQWMRVNAMTAEQKRNIILGKQLNGLSITEDMRDELVKGNLPKNTPLYAYTSVDTKGNTLAKIPQNIIDMLKGKGIDISEYDASYNSVYDKADNGSLIIHQDNTENNTSPIITISLGRPMKFITYELKDSNDFNISDPMNTALRIATNTVAGEALKLNLIPKEHLDSNGRPKYGYLTPSTILDYARKIDIIAKSNLEQFVVDKLKEQFQDGIKSEYTLNNGTILVFSGKNRNVLHEIVFDEETNNLPMPAGFPKLTVNKAFKGLGHADKFVQTNDYRVVLTLRKVQGNTVSNNIRFNNEVMPSSNPNENVYSKLGDNTESENVKIKPWVELKDATSPFTMKGIITTRIKNSNEHFGNLYTHDPAGKAQGLIETKTIQEAVEKYIDWVINSNDERATWIREQIKSGSLKGKNLFYYKELGEPSHATALDYLVNKYDWSQNATEGSAENSNVQKVVEQAKLFKTPREPNLTPNFNEMGEVIVYSGAAKGSDKKWVQKAAYEKTDRQIEYTAETLKRLSDEQRDEVEKAYTQAVKDLGRRELPYDWANPDAVDENNKKKYYGGALVRRDYLQAKAGDAIYAIGTIVKQGEKNKDGYRVTAVNESVDGGTGYAVQMSINLGKPTYVFDQDKNQWFQWNAENQVFEEIRTPILSKRSTLVGTRELNNNGIQAIDDVFEKTKRVLNNTYDSKNAEITSIIEEEPVVEQEEVVDENDPASELRKELFDVVSKKVKILEELKRGATLVDPAVQKLHTIAENLPLLEQNDVLSYFKDNKMKGKPGFDWLGSKEAGAMSLEQAVTNLKSNGIPVYATDEETINKIIELVKNKRIDYFNDYNNKNNNAKELKTLDIKITELQKKIEENKYNKTSVVIDENERTITINGVTLSTVTRRNGTTQPIELTDDQLNAIKHMANHFDAFLDGSGDNQFLLQGYAGTGKSTISLIMSEYIRKRYKELGVTPSGKNIVPTHKAGRIISSFNQMQYYTTAKALGKSPNSFFVWTDGHISGTTLNEQFLIFDEVSMMSDSDFDMFDMIAKERNGETYMIYMGDDAQLPPITKSGKQRVSKFFSTKSKHTLTQVMRFDPKSGIGLLTKTLRDNLHKLGGGIASYGDFGDLEVLNSKKEITAAFANFFKEHEHNVKIIVYGNNSVSNYNEEVRSRLKQEGEYNPGEILFGYQVKDTNREVVENGSDYRITQNNGIVGTSINTYNGTELTFATHSIEAQLLNPAIKYTSLHNYYIVNDSKQSKNFILYYKELLDQARKYELQKDYRRSMSFINMIKDIEGRGIVLGADFYVDSQNNVYTKKEAEQYFGRETLEHMILSHTIFEVEKNIDYGYAITSHKSQGSSYDVVIADESNFSFKEEDRLVYDRNDNFFSFESNNMRYVAFSRARQKLLVYTDKPKSKLDLESVVVPVARPVTKQNKQTVADVVDNSDDVNAEIEAMIRQEQEDRSCE